MPTSPSRRLVLAAVAAVATAGTAGCSTPWGDLRVQPLGGDPPPPEPEPGPDELARRNAVRGVSDALTALDRSAVDAAVAGPLRAALGEQLAALGETAPGSSPTSSPTGSAATSPTTSPTGSPATSPTTSPTGSPTAAVVALMTAAAAAAREPLAEVAGGTARLLACLAAGLDVAAGWASGTPSPGSSGTSSPGSPGTPSAATSGAGPSPSPTAADGAGEQGALAVALAAEEAAEYGYGVLAVRLEGGQRTRAQADLAAHALAVEELREQLLALGAAPPEPPPAWALPGPVTDAAGAVALAVRLESAVTAAAADVVAAADRGRRTADAGRVLVAAQRWQWWRGQQPDTAPALVALPGLSGR